jgi:hypothetical protein
MPIGRDAGLRTDHLLLCLLLADRLVDAQSIGTFGAAQAKAVSGWGGGPVGIGRRNRHVPVEIGCVLVPPPRPALTPCNLRAIDRLMATVAAVLSYLRAAAVTARRAVIPALTSQSRSSGSSAGLLVRHGRLQTTI